MPATIRTATLADASEASALLRASITELCTADHLGDPNRLAGWLRNKTESGWQQWLGREDAWLLVATGSAGEILGVGMAEHAGTILLNYVAPVARFRGVSTAMIAALEDRLRGAGRPVSRLETTHTARRFYLGLGYQPLAPGSDWLERPLTPAGEPPRKQ